MVDLRSNGRAPLAASLLVALALALLLALSPAARGTGSAAIGLRLVGDAGAEIQGQRYLGLVPEDRPWRHPIRETVLTPDEEVPVWSVEPGRYRAVCAARGWAAAFTPAFEATAGEVTTVECRPSRLGSIRGRVVAPAGEPIAGVTVAPLHLLLPDSPVALSATATAFLRHAYGGRSGPNGRFRVRGPAATRGAVWIGAPGREPLLLEGLPFTAGGTLIGDVVLAAGAGVEVDLTIPADRRLAGHQLGLRLLEPASSASPGFPASLANRVWLRPLEGLAGGDGAAAAPGEPASFTVSWPSLPAGRYGVWLKPPSPAAVSPRELARTELAVGELRQLDIVVSVPEPAPADAAIDRVEFFLRHESPAALSRLELLIWREGGAPRRVEDPPRSVVSGGLILHPAGPLHRGEWVVARGGSLVSRPVRMSGGAAVGRDADQGAAAASGGEMTTEPLELLPAGTLAGRLLTAGGQAWPARSSGAGPVPATIRVARCRELAGGAGGAALGSYPVEIGEAGQWRAVVPAGCLDLQLVAGGGQVGWSGVVVEAGATERLGPARLAASASMLLRVVSGADGRGLEGARGELIPADLRVAAEAAAIAGASYRVSGAAVSDAAGWLRLAGIAPGRYTLRLSAAGHAPVMTPAFELTAANETLPPDIELPLPASLAVRLSAGPADGASNEADRSAALVDRETELLVNLDLRVGCCRWQTVAGAAGSGVGDPIFFDDLAPGSYRVAAFLDQRGDPGYRVARRELELTSGEERSLALSVPEEGVLPVRGRVLYQDRPVQGSLRLLAIERSREVARTATDEEGRFEVLLPAPGSYRVVVWSEEPAIAGTAVVVRFERGGAESPDGVIVELPGGAIAGLVLGAAGRPTAEAMVTAISLDGPDGGDRASPDGPLSSSTLTGHDGSFRLEALPAGRWSLGSSSRSKKLRGRTEVELQPDALLAGVAIRLVEAVPLPLAITDAADLPVRGGRIELQPLAAGDGTAASAMVMTTDELGMATPTLGPETAGANLVVEAPGRPVTPFRVAAGSPRELTLPAIGGRLELVPPRDPAGGLVRHRVLLVDASGAFVNPMSLRSAELEAVAGVAGGIAYTIPSLAPGSWRLVAAPLDIAGRSLLLSGAAGQLAELASFELTPGATVRVLVPAPESDTAPP